MIYMKKEKDNSLNKITDIINCLFVSNGISL